MSRQHEGQVFAVPILDSGFSLGVLARAASENLSLAYFFGRIYDKIPNAEAAEGLSAPDALLIRQISNAGLKCGRWPEVGEVSPWIRTDWPVPRFCRSNLLRKTFVEVSYSDADGLTCIAERPISADECTQLHPDGSSGYEAMESRIVKAIEALR